MVLIWPPYTWIFMILNDNLLVNTFTTEIYNPYKYLF